MEPNQVFHYANLLHFLQSFKINISSVRLTFHLSSLRKSNGTRHNLRLRTSLNCSLLFLFLSNRERITKPRQSCSLANWNLFATLSLGLFSKVLNSSNRARLHFAFFSVSNASARELNEDFCLNLKCMFASLSRFSLSNLCSSEIQIVTHDGERNATTPRAFSGDVLFNLAVQVPFVSPSSRAFFFGSRAR